ncbi:predicted protein, partial [Arabidopsis lyrata subsp. lyrata]
RFHFSGSLAIGSLSPPFHTAQRRHFPSSIESSSSYSSHFPINSIRFFRFFYLESDETVDFSGCRNRCFREGGDVRVF